MRPRAFNAAGDPWVGVMARYDEPTNYVYVSLRRSNTVTLRKLETGNCCSKPWIRSPKSAASASSEAAPLPITTTSAR